MRHGKEAAAFLGKDNSMHDLVAHFQSCDSYHDFEGMADPKAVLDKCKDEDGKYVWERSRNEGDFQLIRSLFLAHLYERADTYGIDDMSYNTIIDLYEFVENLVRCRWWSEVTDEMITDIETASDEDA
jgi:hypothetical protein